MYYVCPTIYTSKKVYKSDARATNFVRLIVELRSPAKAWDCQSVQMHRKTVKTFVGHPPRAAWRTVCTSRFEFGPIFHFNVDSAIG